MRCIGEPRPLPPRQAAGSTAVQRQSHFWDRNQKYYKMKLVPKDTIEDMRDLADIISRAVAHGQWWENEARLVKEMNRLIPDRRCGYKKALRDLSMIPLVEEEEETVYSQPDLTDATLWSERQEIAV